MGGDLQGKMAQNEFKIAFLLQRNISSKEIL